MYAIFLNLHSVILISNNIMQEMDKNLIAIEFYSMAETVFLVQICAICVKICSIII